MGAKAPELVHVAGPQRGERVFIVAAESVLGRSAQCDISVKEQFVSRQHVRLEITRDGVVVEDLSPNGMLVNGKRYKPGKKLVLATGDVLGVGMETQMLFVAAGDDVEKAVAAWKAATQPAPAAPAPAAAPTAKPAGDTAAVSEMETVTADGKGRPSAARPPVAAPPVPGLKAAGASAGRELSPPGKPAAAAPAGKQAMPPKMRKYLKYIIVYLVAMGALVLFLAVVVKRGDDNEAVPDASTYLSNDEIAAILREKPRPGRRDDVAAQKSLDAANELFPRRKAEPQDLYRVVSLYNAYLAAKDPPVFETAIDNEKFDTALKELIDAVTAKYNNARAHEQNKNYAAARQIYTDLLAMLPVGNEKSSVHERLRSNIVRHLSFVSRKSRR